MSIDAEWQAAYGRLLIQYQLVPQGDLEQIARSCAERRIGLRDHLLHTGVISPQDDARLIATLQAAARIPTTGHGSRSGTHRVPPAALPNPGETFAGYTIQSEIARGGAGAVYVALAPDGTRIALKVLLHDVTLGARRQRFLREVEIGTALKHPGIVQVLDHGEAEGRPYLVMELLENATPLDRYVDLNVPPPLERARLVMEVAQAVHAAHQAGIIHRDLKPDNVLVTEEGQIKVVDFGIARQADRERLTQSGAVMGTLHYMPPEQIRGQSAHVDARADVYSLGVMLYRLISGELPYDGETSVQVMSAILDKPVPDLRASVPDVPPGLPEVIRVAMAKAPENRYDSASEFAQDLVAVSSGSDTAALSRLHHIPEAKPGRWIAVSALVLLLALGAGAALWLTRDADPKELKRLAGPIYDEAWTLLCASEARLSTDSQRVEELLGKMRRLEDLAQGADAKKVLDRPHRRLRALEGLLALSQGDRAAARACANPNDNPNPVESALLGGLQATDPEGDHEGAARLLSQALARGIKRADLHLWRALAWSRVGFSGNQAELAIGGLDVLQAASGGALTWEESCLRARALVAAQRPGEADALLSGLEKPAPAGLRWDVALVGAAMTLETDPQEACELLEDLPHQDPPDPRRSELAAKADLAAKRMLRDLGDGTVTPAQEQQLVAWTLLLRRLDPAAPSPELVSALLAEATGIKADAGLPHLGMALARLFPNDAAIQNQIGRLAPRSRDDRELVKKFVILLRRAIGIEADAQEKVVLRSILLALLRDRLRNGDALEGEYEEAIATADAVLEETDDSVKRGELLWRRADVYLERQDYESALRDANEAVALNEKDIRFVHLRADALLKLRRDEECLPAAVSLAKLTDGHKYSNMTLVILWTLARRGQDPARVCEGLAPLVARQTYNPGWWVRLAWLQLESGQGDRALASLQKAVSQTPKKGAVAELLGRIRELEVAVSERRPDAQAKAEALVETLEALRKNGYRP